MTTSHDTRITWGFIHRDGDRWLWYVNNRAGKLQKVYAYRNLRNKELYYDYDAPPLWRTRPLEPTYLPTLPTATPTTTTTTSTRNEGVRGSEEEPEMSKCAVCGHHYCLHAVVKCWCGCPNRRDF